MRDPTGITTFAGTYKDPLTNTAVWTAARLAQIQYLNMIKGNPLEIRTD